MRRSTLVVFMLGVFLGALRTYATTVISTFDATLEGWTSDNTPAEVTWASPGGNPNGYARFVDATNNVTEIQAPAGFLGDWAAFEGGMLSFDFKVIEPGDEPDYAPYTIHLSGPGGTASWYGATPSGPTEWVRVAAQLTEADWSVTSGTWEALLADVTGLRIRIEIIINNVPYQPTGEVSGLDNVVLTDEPYAIPTLSRWGLVAMTLLVLSAGTLVLRRPQTARA